MLSCLFMLCYFIELIMLEALYHKMIAVIRIIGKKYL